MPALGKRNTLTIVRHGPHGYYLDGGRLGEILLPGRYLPPGAQVGDPIDIFLYRDSEDRLVATTENPIAAVGQFAMLRVVSENPSIGAFLDWGLEKDLLLPRREFAGGVFPGKRILVFIMVDPVSDRIVASARLNRHLDLTRPAYTVGQRVALIVESETPLGYKAIIEHAHTGLIYRSEIAGPLKIGQPLTGYIRAIRPDGKIDLGLDRAGATRIVPHIDEILAALEKAGGHLPYHDASPPDEIRAALSMSKKAFKQAIGTLFRLRRIRIEQDGIHLVRAEKKERPTG